MKNHKTLIPMLALMLLLIYPNRGFAVITAPTTTIDISSLTNIGWCSGDFINCSTFPFGQQTYDGIPYLIPGNAQGTANNVWYSNTAAGGGSGVVSVTIPINVAKIKTVYTLMNTGWGTTQAGLLSVTFTGSAGATWTVNLVGGANVRDYNQNGSTTNSILCQLPGAAAKSATINAWVNGAGQRLDEQVYELPAAFHTQTLVSMTITDNGNSGEQRSFLAAVTVSTVIP
jgi:hypothetical protein